MRLLAHKKNLDSYLEQYPEDESVIRNIKDSLTDKDFITDGTSKIRGRAIFDYVSLFTFGFKESWMHCHNYMVHNKDKFNKREFLNFANFFIFKNVGIQSRESMVNIVFNRLEGYETNKKPLSVAYNEIFTELKKSGNNPYKWPIGEEAFGHFGLDHPALEKADKVDFGEFNFLKIKDVYKGFKQNPNLTMYLYSSSLDTFSPPEMYVDFVKGAGKNVKYKNFEESGHESIFTESEILETLKKVSRLK
ncbi:MAG: hypothetical protein NE334_21260 [Lentisphaeraceae bacterium]|nr:hypothetical protein [Lentisphaeraceae bacterium]